LHHFGASLCQIHERRLNAHLLAAAWHMDGHSVFHLHSSAAAHHLLFAALLNREASYGTLTIMKCNIHVY
jgi:hypothetical protein